MVDLMGTGIVPKSRVEEITQLVKRHHPEAGEKGTEPTMPAFP